jgi:hypothetical protein
LAISVAFVAGGVVMIRSGEKAGWFVAGFFGLGGIVALVQFLPNASYLLLTSGGFLVCSAFRKSMYGWGDVARFRAIAVYRNQMVGFDFAPGYTGQRAARWVAGAMAGAEAALPDTYGMSPQALADLMNDWRERHAGSSAVGPPPQ